MKTDTVYIVKKQEPCPECHGTGMVQHGAWAAFWTDGTNSRLLPDEEIEKWFHDNGYTEVPDEEIPCYECAGTGLKETEVPLDEALKHMLYIFAGM